MSETIITAMITALGGIIVGGFSVWSTNSKVLYRIQLLEQKVEKHNNLVEKVSLSEQDRKTIWHSINRIEKDMNELIKAR